MVIGPLRGPGSSIPLVIFRTSSLIKERKGKSNSSLNVIFCAKRSYKQTVLFTAKSLTFYGVISMICESADHEEKKIVRFVFYNNMKTLQAEFYFIFRCQSESESALRTIYTVRVLLK